MKKRVGERGGGCIVEKLYISIYETQLQSSKTCIIASPDNIPPAEESKEQQVQARCEEVGGSATPDHVRPVMSLQHP